MTNPAWLIVLALGLGACVSHKTEAEKEYGVTKADPQKVPATMPVYGVQESVLVATFITTKGGYRAITRIGQGVPTSTIHQSRPVLVTARGGTGDVIASVSVFNPREIRTAGTSKPDSAVADSSSFTVTLPKPDAIRRLDVAVRRGPDSGYRAGFAIERGTARPVR